MGSNPVPMFIYYIRNVMSKIYVTVRGPKTTVQLKLVHAPNETMPMKKAAIIWRYKNLPVDTVNTFDGTQNVEIWLTDFLDDQENVGKKKPVIIVEALRHYGKCRSP